MTVGRNFAEVIRALDALQLPTSKGVATPADWQAGQDVIIPVPSTIRKLKVGLAVLKNDCHICER